MGTGRRLENEERYYKALLTVSRMVQLRGVAEEEYSKRWKKKEGWPRRPPGVTGWCERRVSWAQATVANCYTVRD